MQECDWSRTSKKTGNVTFTACSSGGKPLLLKLENVRVAFEPSVYGGDGTEVRKNICFKNVSEDLRNTILAMETSLAFNPPVCSAIKDDLVKAKVSMDKVRIFDDAREIIDAPKNWRGWEAHAIIQVRGRWETRTQCGLSLELTDIQLLRQAQDDTQCPF
tara:strand:- start:2218 stop:2697 length:480 start_codon:yes stop_codon:yes gene_type:complete